ncbi:MAG TPA: SUMF1/EgtB/PvdO family nonheme iron enzyme [Bacteroidales bacterium]|nr:SUMF1/EgtB/PvdO family nonheme iron enzyme [Bacteroidales bacterium]
MIHREVAIAFFNGYGTELNMFRPGGRDDKYREDMDFLSKTTFTLRQNNDAFLDQDWTPLVSTMEDRVYVNRWTSSDKTIFTVLNMRHEGIDGPLFRGVSRKGWHWVSLWNHKSLEPAINNGVSCIPAYADGWSSSYDGTRKEGSVDCIAELPELIKASLQGDFLSVNSTGKGTLTIWKGNPSYASQSKELKLKSDTTIRIKDLFGFYEGKVVLQLTENNKLKDEVILEAEGGKPWLVSRVAQTERATEPLVDMVLVPGSKFSFEVTANEDFMPYPQSSRTVEVDSFLIDKFPVTNEQYYDFLMSSGYSPADTTRFLRHWKGGIYKQGQERYPVVNLSLEDMNAYAKWAGKRLPTEAEWQLAAQGPDKRKWPWGDEFHGALCNNSFDRPTPVDAFKKGQSPYGVIDLVGNVWQMTSDMYFNGSYYMSIIRGGSYYKPDSSWWYIQGGPQPLDKTQILLMVSPGFDRSNTLGFRCVKDIDSRKFVDSKKK